MLFDSKGSYDQRNEKELIKKKKKQTVNKKTGSWNGRLGEKKNIGAIATFTE